MFNRKINCPHCHRNLMIDFQDYVIDTEVEDREMGAYAMHHVEAEELECAYCKCFFDVAGSIFEYPEGVDNGDDLDPVAR